MIWTRVAHTSVRAAQNKFPHSVDNYSSRAGGCCSLRICPYWLHSTTQSSPDISRRNAITHAAVKNPDTQIWKSRISISRKLKMYYPSSCTAMSVWQLPREIRARLMLSINGVCERWSESNGTTMCGMVMCDGQPHVDWAEIQPCSTVPQFRATEKSNRVNYINPLTPTVAIWVQI